MKHAIAHWDKFQRQIADKYVMLFLDYDGTLTPIVESPAKALISKQTKHLLKSLSSNYRCKLAIISGRALHDIKKKIGIRNIIYSGNHGLEIEGPSIRFEVPVSFNYKTVIKQIKKQLNKRLSPINGILLEDKGFSLSLHYRLVDKKRIPFVKTTFNEVVSPYLNNKIKIKTGKKVFEIRPAVEWDKGEVALWLLNRLKLHFGNRQILPIYIGDDVTDEDAFKALKDKGLTIFVGTTKKSHAKYHLKNTKEVFEFLRRLCSLLSLKPPSLNMH